MSKSNNNASSTEVPSVEEQIAAEMATWPVNVRLCYSCGATITEGQLKNIACTEVDKINSKWVVTHGAGDCVQSPTAFPVPISQAFGETAGKTADSPAKVNAMAQATSAMEMAMELMAEAKAMVKAEKAEQAKWGPMTEAETAMAAAKSMKKQAQKMKAAAKKL